MAKALPAGRPVHRRSLFGLFDSEGWGWAFTKAFFWLLVIIMALGYVPDRAYYFVVSRTIDLGILGWSPVNLCPPENGTAMPCPVPVGGVVPWQASPTEVSLPQPRTNGAAAQLGKNLLYIGGTDSTDGAAPSATTYVATIDVGHPRRVGRGPGAARGPRRRRDHDAQRHGLPGRRPRPRRRPDRHRLVHRARPGHERARDLGRARGRGWRRRGHVTLPEPRSGAAVVAVTDGIIVAGGRGPDGQPTSTVWKSTLDDAGFLRSSRSSPPSRSRSPTRTSRSRARSSGSTAAPTPTARSVAVQRADYGALPRDGQPGARYERGTLAGRTPPAASGEAPQGVVKWTVSDALNLPGARTAAPGSRPMAPSTSSAARTARRRSASSTGPSRTRRATCPAGGTTSTRPTSRKGSENAAVVVSGSTVFLLGGDAGSGALATSYRASLAPEEPFFRLGLVGVVVPGAPDRRGDRPAARLPGRRGRRHGQLRGPRRDRLGVQPQGIDPRLVGAPQGTQGSAGPASGLAGFSPAPPPPRLAGSRRRRLRPSRLLAGAASGLAGFSPAPPPA